MRRRDFVQGIAASTACPLAARAQHSGQVRRVGVLMAYGEMDTEAQARIKVFGERLRQLGWEDGQNIRFDYRWTAGRDDLAREFAKELADLGLDAIVGQGTPAARALQQVTTTIPVVFVQVTNPVDAGFVRSLAHPGGNITGFAMYEPEMATKWLEILKEIAPSTVRVELIFNPETAPGRGTWFQRAIEAASPSFSLKLLAIPVHNAAEIQHAFDTIAQEPNTTLLVPPDTTTLVHRDLFVRLTAEHRIPAIYSQSSFVHSGGLISYGVDTIELFRQTASYVDRILRGEKPSDLPVQEPTKFELVINMKTAKTLGLTIPQDLQATADEVIE
jgi:putative tryptophan/tyrosine transport system substrate-binding protein